MDDQTAKLLPYLVPALIIVLVLRRNLRERQLKVERLWVMPLIIVLAIGLGIAANPPTAVLAYVAMAVGLLLGCVAGFYRGRFTTISVNPDTHDLTSKASMLGVIFIAVLFAARYGLRYYLDQTGGGEHHALDASATALTDGLLVFSVGMMGTQRIEMWVRARRLLAEAIAAKAARGGSVAAP